MSTIPGIPDEESRSDLSAPKTGAEAEVVIDIRDLHTSYGGKKVLTGVSLQVRRGEIMIILGRSGCGKSTLMRHMIGLHQATGGSINILGIDICDASEEELNQVRKRMGVLYQSGALFNSMSLLDNVALPLREHTKLNDNVIKINARLKLGLVGLAGYEGYLPSAISGGMKKRAGFARALALDPDIVFFDEPSAGLDPVIGAELDEFIIRINKTFGTTMVVVTHELASVFRIADRITMLDTGRVLRVGTWSDMKQDDHPAIKQFFDRVPDSQPVDKERYLSFLTGHGQEEM